MKRSDLINIKIFLKQELLRFENETATMQKTLDAFSDMDPKHMMQWRVERLQTLGHLLDAVNRELELLL